MLKMLFLAEKLPKVMSNWEKYEFMCLGYKNTKRSFPEAILKNRVKTIAERAQVVYFVSSKWHIFC